MVTFGWFLKKLTFVTCFHSREKFSYTSARGFWFSAVSQRLRVLKSYLSAYVSYFLTYTSVISHTHLLFRIHICFFDTHLLFYVWFLRGILHICYFVTHLLFRYTSVISLHICYYNFCELAAGNGYNKREPPTTTPPPTPPHQATFGSTHCQLPLSYRCHRIATTPLHNTVCWVKLLLGPICRVEEGGTDSCLEAEESPILGRCHAKIVLVDTWDVEVIDDPAKAIWKPLCNTS
jgi:hypothetical protein